MPLRVEKHRNRQHHVNLFMLYDDGTKSELDGTKNPPADASTETPLEETEVVNEPKYHTLVRNLSALLWQDTEKNRNINVCPYCLHIFCQNKKGYETHLIYCKIHSGVNNDLGFKAKAKDLGFKAKAKDLSFKAKAKDLSLTAKAKNLSFKAKDLRIGP